MIRFGRDLATEAGMAGKDISVKKYVVRLSAGEREHMQALIRKGKSPAKRLLKARILLKADVSEAGEGWSDSWIIQALDTSASMIYRVRKQLVEEGFEAVLSRKRRMTPPDLCDGCATASGSGLYGAPALARLQHGGDAGIARNVLDAALVPALGLRLGLSLSLPAAMIVVMLARYRGEHVEQHALNRLDHPAGEFVRLGSHKP